MNADFQEFSSLWSAIHGNVPVTGLVRAWLRISYRVARICTALRIGPDLITYMGVVAAGATALFATHWWAAFLLAFSLFCDGIDGSVAIVQKAGSKMGSVIDSIADRTAEAFWAVAFYRVGAPLSWVLVLWGAAFLQEYARARLKSLGVEDVGVVTPAERPVRASFLFIAILAWHFSSFRGWVTGLAASLALLQSVSFYLVFRFARARLK